MGDRRDHDRAHHCGIDLAARRPRHRPAWRPAGAGLQLDRDRVRLRRACARLVAAGLPARVGPPRRRHGRRALRRGVRRARASLRRRARGAITSLTLFGGFGSTVCWPLSAWLLATWDWRVTCLVYAGIHLAVSLPIHALMFPAAPAQREGGRNGAAAGPVPALSSAERVVFWLLAGVQMLAQAIGAIVIVHLLVFLQARGLTLTAAVALGTLFGPAQVGARVIERMFGARYHPIWTMIAAAALMTLGLALLLIDLPVVAAAVVVYGAGYGVTWIARGTLPLALFGPERYPVLIGRLALPSIIAPALAPVAGALMIERIGPLRRSRC